MINEKEILFVTTTLYTKWLDYQQKIIKREFPDSQILIVDGRHSWPNSWFNWLTKLSEYSGIKWVIHLDEDCFIESKEAILKTIENMENNNIDVCGVLDSLFHYRGANPAALNTFFMIVRYDKLTTLIPKLNLDNLKFGYDNVRGWINNFGVSFKSEWLDNFKYKFDSQMNGYNTNFEQEPYYYFMWMMRENNFVFDYLFPFFDERFKSTNPRLSVDGVDICIHMWYLRNHQSSEDIWGLPNCKRYELLEKYLNEYKDEN